MSIDKKTYMKEWRRTHMDHIREYDRQFRKLNPEKVREKDRRRRNTPNRQVAIKRHRQKYRKEIAARKAAWQVKNKEHLRAYLKQWSLNHSEEIRERSRKWYRDNPGRHSVHIVKRRAICAECPTEEVKIINEWMREIRSKPFARCYWCGTKVSGGKIHFDHITPLAKGGRHSIGNLCAACPDCNLTKHDRLPVDWSVGGQQFLTL